jgi:hypothetical protein
LCIVGLVGSMVLYIWVSGEAHDARSLDDSQIWEAAKTGCLGVTQAVDGAGDDRRARVVDGNTAIGELVRGIEALGASKLADDDPALEWVADWQRLAAARAAYADRVGESSTGLFRIPQTDDGFPITQRMVDVAPPECKLAVALASQP